MRTKKYMETLALHTKKVEFSSPFPLLLLINARAWIWVFFSPPESSLKGYPTSKMAEGTPSPLKRKTMEHILESA